MYKDYFRTFVKVYSLIELVVVKLGDFCKCACML